MFAFGLVIGVITGFALGTIFGIMAALVVMGEIRDRRAAVAFLKGMFEGSGLIDCCRKGGTGNER